MSIGRLVLFVLTLLIFAMAGIAVFVNPPPLWVPLGLGALYLAVIVYGVMNIRWRMFGDAICEVPDARGLIALTFDDGPDPVSTRLVLQALREAGVVATFFVVGKKAARHPEILREIVNQGHSLGVHSYNHERLYSFLPPDVVRQDIERTRDVIEEYTARRPVWFRPPIGQMSPRTAAGVERAAGIVIGWNVRAHDGLVSTTTENCRSRVFRGLEQGAIVLLHDAWESGEVEEGGQALDRSPAGVRALRDILTECERRQLRPVTIDQLLEASA